MDQSTRTSTKNWTVERFGQEQEPVVIIDRFTSDPEQLLRVADTADFQDSGTYYPGLRAPAPAEYLGERASLLKDILIQEFGLHQGAHLVECNFSIVSRRPEGLEPFQRLPHFDGLEDGRLAVLHYLCGPEHGGTSFVRHKTTGFETVTSDRFETFRDTLAEEARTLGLPPAKYFSEDTAQFERIGRIEAKFNRMIIYRGRTLHSGHIPLYQNLQTSPRSGRLTVNTFLSPKRV